MALIRLTLPADLPPIPPKISAFIADAQARIEAFIQSRLNEPIHSFVPSDFPLVYGALRHVAEEHLAPGPLFCEWGSGAGVVTCLAAMLGFEACGIEVEGDLVDLAVALARRHHVRAGFCLGNFVPHEGQAIAAQTEEFEWLAVGGRDPYAEMDLDICDFDVIFAYPWPGEERVIERLFERFAANGALLMTYNGHEGVRLFRKRAGRHG